MSIFNKLFLVSFFVLALVAKVAYSFHPETHIEESDKHLHVAYMENLAKYYVDEDGNYKGFSKEIYSFIADQLGYELDLVVSPTFRVVSDFYTGSSAFLMSPSFLVAQDNDEDEGILASDEVMCISYSFVALKGNEIRRVEDLAGKRVAFGLAGSFLKKYQMLLGNAENPMIPIKALSATEAIRMLAYDRVDVAFLPTFFYQPVLNSSEELTGISEEQKDKIGEPWVVEKVNFRFHLHPNSPLYPQADKFMKMINGFAKDGVFLDIVRRVETNKEAFCDMKLN